MSNFSKLILSSTAIILLFLNQTVWGSSGDNQWPAWGGPQRNFVANAGIIKADQPFELRIAWKKTLGSGYSAVSVKDNMAITMFSDSTYDYTVALNAENGQELWRFKIDSTFPGRFGSANGPISTPLISQNIVVGLSAAGRLFALDSKTGKLKWDTDLVAGHQGQMPFYGFSTSPLVYKNILLVETGGTKSNAFSAFNLQTGAVMWTVGADTIEYQSPYLWQNEEDSHFIAVSNSAVYGLEPATGKILWQLEHQGGYYIMGASSGNVVPVGKNQFFLKDKKASGMLFEVTREKNKYQAQEVWRTKWIRGTYVVPVYHEGNLYAYKNRILSCVDVQNGDRIWKSRKPGDGFPIVVDGHLVVVTKRGKLSVAPASPEGYNEITSLELFDNLVWAPPSFADGKLFLRSMTEIAAVEIVPTQVIAKSAQRNEGIVASSNFARFVKEVEQATDKTALIDDYMASQKDFPVIEGDDVVHFIYRGEATDMALMGDLVGWRYDWPMHRVEGTDLFYYSTRLEPDAMLTYKFVKDLQTRQPDSLNTRAIKTMYFGEASWFNMPQWEKPDFLTQIASQQGRIDSLSFKSNINDSSRVIEVYLPAGYDQSSELYSIAYIHGGKTAKNLGNMTTALDNLIGSSVRPTIVVFMPTFYGGFYSEFVGEKRDVYTKVFVEEILPFVEQTYRILPGPANRANIGQMFSGFMAVYSTFMHQDLFGNLGIQSLYWDEKEAKNQTKLFTVNDRDNMLIYFDWGKYDFRSPLESIDLVDANRKFTAMLKDRSIKFTGGEVHAGTGWGSWQNRIDRMMEIFFPLRDMNTQSRVKTKLSK
jgi:outer membrane protein assembly factor BamB/enterochelin esterase-like enzyme